MLKMLKLLFVLLMFLPLVGCHHTLADEANDQARKAFEVGDLSRGSLLLTAGCKTLHEQSIYLLRMVNYESAGEMHQAISMLWRINALDARQDFVEVAARAFLDESISVLLLENSQ